MVYLTCAKHLSYDLLKAHHLTVFFTALHKLDKVESNLIRWERRSIRSLSAIREVDSLKTRQQLCFDRGVLVPNQRKRSKNRRKKIVMSCELFIDDEDIYEGMLL